MSLGYVGSSDTCRCGGCDVLTRAEVLPYYVPLLLLPFVTGLLLAAVIDRKSKLHLSWDGPYQVIGTKNRHWNGASLGVRQKSHFSRAAAGPRVAKIGSVPPVRGPTWLGPLLCARNRGTTSHSQDWLKVA